MSMMLEHSLALMVVSPITAALIIKLLSRFEHPDEIRDIVTFTGLLLPLILLLFTSRRAEIVYEMGGWVRPYGISLVLDGLSRAMVLITGVVTLSTYVYYVDFLDQDPRGDDYHFFYLFMTAGIYGVFLTGDLVNRFIFFEITILTTYVLLTFIGTKESLKASFRYFIMGTIASLMYLTGIGLTYFYTGYLDLEALSRTVPLLSPSTRNIIFVFFLIAVGIKLGIMPFHTWLPDAHVEAPTPMTAIMAGITVKTGGYIMLKFYKIGFQTLEIQYFFVALGIFTALFGALLSLKYMNMKKILAWLTISHMGVIAIMFSLWTPGSLAAGLLYFINHSFYKALLFLSVGAFAYIYGTSDIRKLPLLKSNVILSSSFLIGLLALIGVPPMNGFYSRWLIFSVLENPVLLVVMILTGVLTSASVIRMFLLSSRENRPKRNDLTEGMMAPLIVLAGLTSFGGLSTSIFLGNIIDPAVASIFGTETGLMTSGIGMGAISSFYGILVLFTIVAGLLLLLPLKIKSISSPWMEYRFSKVTIRDSVRYVIYALAFFLLLNFLYGGIG
ncbi:MAG: proton-conducting transporter membrane subunit [Candidatus Thermoplasmatota archaeon]